MELGHACLYTLSVLRVLVLVHTAHCGKGCHNATRNIFGVIRLLGSLQRHPYFGYATPCYTLNCLLRATGESSTLYTCRSGPTSTSG